MISEIYIHVQGAILNHSYIIPVKRLSSLSSIS